jgi:hypothetical protein
MFAQQLLVAPLALTTSGLVHQYVVPAHLAAKHVLMLVRVQPVNQVYMLIPPLMLAKLAVLIVIPALVVPFVPLVKLVILLMVLPMLVLHAQPNVILVPMLPIAQLVQ